MRSYEAARGLFSFLGFLSWVVIIVGIIVGLSSIVSVAEAARRWGGSPDGMKLLMIALPGLGIALVGVIGLAIVQNGRATVDTAEYTQQMLQIARDQIEISRRTLKLQQGAPATSFGEALAESDEPGSEAEDAGASFADLAREQSVADDIDGHAFTPIDAGQGFTQLNAAATKLGYRGRTVRIVDGRFNLDGEIFGSLDAVRSHIDRFDDEARPIDKTQVAGTNSAPKAQLILKANSMPEVGTGKDTKGTRGKDLAGEAEPEPEAPEIETIAYKGTSITVEAGRFCVGNRGFKTLALAQAYVDSHS